MGTSILWCSWPLPNSSYQNSSNMPFLSLGFPSLAELKHNYQSTEFKIGYLLLTAWVEELGVFIKYLCCPAVQQGFPRQSPHQLPRSSWATNSGDVSPWGSAISSCWSCFWVQSWQVKQAARASLCSSAIVTLREDVAIFYVCLYVERKPFAFFITGGLCHSSPSQKYAESLLLGSCISSSQ